MVKTKNKITKEPQKCNRKPLSVINENSSIYSEVGENSTIESKNIQSDRSDEIQELLAALKSKFTKKAVENQKQLQVEVQDKSKKVFKNLQEAFQSNESDIAQKVTSIREALETHKQERNSTLKRLKSDAESLVQQFQNAISGFEKSNEQISKMISEFETEAESSKHKRKERFFQVHRETEGEMAELVNLLATYANKHSEGAESIKNSLSALLKFN